jgi:hypothetical protein
VTTVRLCDLKHPSLKFCNRTARKVFFARHGLDWRRFVFEGLPAAELEATGDAMALAVVAAAKEREAREAASGARYG